MKQDILRGSTVAIAGVGATGGHHLLALARMGVGGFRIADPDSYEMLNIHRQAGAFVDTIGRGKTETMAEILRGINPDVRLACFPVAIDEQNVDEFLEDADVVVDGIDFFQIDARRLLFNKAREKGLYALTAGPVGFGTSIQIFDPEGMSFDEYFGIRGDMTRAERLASFAAGLLPKLPRRRDMKTSSVDFIREKGPALISAIMLCSGVMAAETVRVLLGDGDIKCVPYSFYIDPYNRQYYRRRESRMWAAIRRKVLTWMGFRRYPTLRELHETERERTRKSVLTLVPGEGIGL